MQRIKPRLSYSGLTVVLSNPSRFDTDGKSLLTATGGLLINDFCFRPEFNVMQCDIRVKEDTSPWIDGTKCILLLGEEAMHQYVQDSRGNTLNELRGSPLLVDNIPAIASYLPQEAADVVNHESRLNPLSANYTIEDEVDEDKKEGDVKAHGNTSMKNYPFWLRRDVWKCKQIMKLGYVPTHKQPRYKLYPSCDEVVSILTNTKNSIMDFDIETNYERQDLLCFSFTFDNETVYCVPVLNNNYEWAYSRLHHIMRALAIAFRDNIIVAHNGALFDFWVLAVKYKILTYRTMDTMGMMHRCYPEVEKSLGHCVSYWTWERFHKDTDSRAYFTTEHMMTKLQYCGKDVFTMRLVREEITKFSKTIPGLVDSIQCFNDSIKPYLITSIQGIRYSKKKLDIIKHENDRLMMQYLRMIKLLIGENGMEDCKKAVKGKAKGFAGSNTQCVKYFHDLMGYAVVAKTPAGAPSLGKKAMFKLALKYNNPVITLVLMYRILQKEYGTLKFTPWRDDSGAITKPEDYEDGELLIRYPCPVSQSSEVTSV